MTKYRNKSKTYNKSKKKLKRFTRKHIRKYKGKRMNKKQIGGNINVDVMDDMPDLTGKNYEQIYIAVGAKYETNYPSTLENTGLYQLLPSFIMSQHNLIIIIDVFSPDELERNKTMILQKYNRNYDDMIHIDFIIINATFDQIMADKILHYVSARPTAIETDIPLHLQLVICDYVVFLSPMPTRTENDIENDINKCFVYMSKTLPNNVYKWIGNMNTHLVAKIAWYDVVKYKLSSLSRNNSSTQMKFIKDATINIVDFDY